MARRRMVDPDLWLDEALAKCSPYARLLFIGLWGICDDNYATLPNRPTWIKAQVFPYENIDTHALLSELSVSGVIILFKHKKREYWFIKNFFKYQTVNRPSKPKYPKYSEKTHGVLSEYSVSTHTEVKLSKEKRREENILTLTKNQIMQLKTQFPTVNVKLELSRAKDYLKSEGIVKKDYLAWFRNWLRRSVDFVKEKKKPKVKKVAYKENPIFGKVEKKVTPKQREKNIKTLDEIRKELKRKLKL